MELTPDEIFQKSILFQHYRQQPLLKRLLFPFQQRNSRVL